ncbi:hypothetical protein ACN28S_08725 [Cystobacter fuscus]
MDRRIGSSSSRPAYSSYSSSSSRSHHSSDPYYSSGSHHSSDPYYSSGTHSSSDPYYSSGTHSSSDPYYSSGTHSSSDPYYSSGTHSSSYSSSSYGGGGGGGSGGYQYSPSYTPPSSHERRDHIRMQAEQKPSFYGKLVRPVNDGLQRGGYGISPSSYHSVQQNLDGVHGGSRSQSEAHFREAVGFGRDATHSYSRGDYGQAGMEALGSAVNTVGGFGTAWPAGSEKLYRQTTPEKKGYGDW